MGIAAATNTATNIIRTFRNIRFELLVGVAGGAPSSPDPDDALNDIRLGDVVVSCPGNGQGKPFNLSILVRALTLQIFRWCSSGRLWQTGRTF